MRKTTERNFSGSLILSRSQQTLPFERRPDHENQFEDEYSLHLDNLLDSELLFDIRSLLHSEDPSELEGLFDLEMSDLCINNGSVATSLIKTSRSGKVFWRWVRGHRGERQTPKPVQTDSS